MFNNIPDEMKYYNQWVVWRYETRTRGNGEVVPTKVPYSPHGRYKAEVNDPSTWGDFHTACRVARDYPEDVAGIGFVLTEQDPYGFIDLDDPAKDETDPQVIRELYDRQLAIYNAFDSYAEMSPSGKGLHIIVRGGIPSGRRRGKIEAYSDVRFMTMTGDVYRNQSINDHDEMFNVLWDELGGGRGQQDDSGVNGDERIDDDRLIEVALNASNGEKFRRLLDGDWHSDNFPSQSEADLAFINIVAFYTDNREQVARIFRRSPLGARNKQTTIRGIPYLDYMVGKAFDRKLPPIDTSRLKDNLMKAMIGRANEPAPNDMPYHPQDEPAQPVEQPKPMALSGPYSVPPGLMGEIAQFVFEQAPRPVPEIALGAAIGMMAGICGRAFNISGTGLNQYVLVLAATGSGKEAANMGISKLFAAAKTAVPSAGDFVGPAEIASPQALTKYMSKKSTSFVSVMGEFGLAMQQMCHPKAHPMQVGIRRMLLDLFNKSGEGQSVAPTIYSDSDKNTQTILSPAFTILGESTQERFYEGLDESMISEGLLPRFTLIEYNGPRPAQNYQAGWVRPGHELVTRIGELCAQAIMLNNANKATIVQQDSEAMERFVAFDQQCDRRINSPQANELTKQLWNRAHIKALKLAALVAVGVHPYRPVVTLADADWAIRIIENDARTIIKRFESGEVGANTEEHKQYELIVKMIREYFCRPLSELSGYGTNEQLYAEKIVPLTYISRRCSKMAVFRADRTGATNAIKRVVGLMMERGEIVEISKLKLQTDFGTSARSFMVSDLQAFGF